MAEINLHAVIRAKILEEVVVAEVLIVVIVAAAVWKELSPLLSQ